MIIKGNRHGNGAKLAAYLLDGGKHGERVAAPELHGFGLYPDDISKSFGALDAMGHGLGIENPLFHIQIRLPEGEQMKPEQWDITTARVLKTAGLEGQPYARVSHTDEKTGEIHCHLGVSLIDEQTHKAKAVPFYKLRFKALARKLEVEFDLTRVSNHRDGPIQYGATKNEEQQAQRLGFKKEAVRNSIRQCWDATDCGRGFDDALAEAGLILAQGDRRNYVVIDIKGGVHSVSQRILAMSPSQIAEKLSDLDRESMPTVAQAREFMLDLPRDEVERLTRELAEVQKQIEAQKEAEREYAQRDPVADEIKWMDAVANAAIEKEKIERQFVEQKAAPTEPALEETRAGAQEEKRQQRAPELGKTQAEIRLARVLSPGPQSFANALEDRGFILTRVTENDIQKDLEKLREEWEERRRNPQSWMEHEGGYAALPPEFQESASRSFEQWEARKQQDQPRQQQAKPFTPDDYLTRVQTEWAEALRPVPATDKNEAEEKQRQKRLEAYVKFVQKKWAEGPHSHLERAAGGLAVVTPFGSVFTLTPRNTGLSPEELPLYLEGIDRAPLLSVTDAQAVMEDVKEHRRAEWQHRHEEWLMRQPVGATAAGIRLAYNLTQTGPEFAAAIEDRGLIMACTTEADAERLNRWERQRLRETRAGQAPEQETKQPRKERDIDSYAKYQAGELVIVNQYGGVFQLTAATTGAHAAEREERLKEIDRAPLMDVTSAQTAMLHYQRHQRQEWRQQREDTYRQGLNEKVSPVSPPQPERQAPGLFAQAANEAAADHRVEDLRGVAAVVWELYRRAGNEYYFDNMHEATARHAMKTGDREAFAAALDERGISFARATKEEADNSHRQAAFAREIGNYEPRYKEGEIVIVTEAPLEYRREGQIVEPRRVHKLDPDLAAKFVETLGTAGKLQSIEATLKASDERTRQRRDERDELQLERAERNELWLEKVRSFAQDSGKGPKLPIRAAEAPARAAASAFNVGVELAALVFSLGTPKSPKAQAKENRENAKATARSNAETDFQIDVAQYAAARAQEQAGREQQRQQEQAARDREREQLQEQERSRQR